MNIEDDSRYDIQPEVRAELTTLREQLAKVEALNMADYTEAGWHRATELESTIADLTARLAKAESALATVRELRDFETKQIVELRSENDSMRYILTQYQLGNAHATKDELVAAASHYDEAERLLETLNQKAGEPPCRDQQPASTLTTEVTKSATSDAASRSDPESAADNLKGTAVNPLIQDILNRFHIH